MAKNNATEYDLQTLAKLIGWMAPTDLPLPDGIPEFPWDYSGSPYLLAQICPGCFAASLPHPGYPPAMAIVMAFTKENAMERAKKMLEPLVKERNRERWPPFFIEEIGELADGLLERVEHSDWESSDILEKLEAVLKGKMAKSEEMRKKIQKELDEMRAKAEKEKK